MLLPAVVLARGWGLADDGGVRWLVTPQGERFFSIGANTIHAQDDPVKAAQRMAYDWRHQYPTLQAWGAATQRRLLSWGFNTAGGWSEPSAVMSMPLIPEVDLGRKAHLHWFDIFDASKPARTEAVAREIVETFRDNPRVIGYFTDNEVGWWASPLFLWNLALRWEAASKREVWQLLHDTYGGRWDRLLADFVPSSPGLDSFERLKEAGAVLKLRPGGQGIRVVGEFTYRIARRYYQLTHDALRLTDPRALIVGDRLPLYYDPNAVRAQQGLADVLSTNYNVDAEDGWVAPYYFEGLRDLTTAPVLVSEFFFAADENRSGNTNNGHLMHVRTQAERAAGARAAVANFAAFPNVVGVHWFQYTDEPTGGRSDGEDFNMGLVDIHDRPYEELVAALADVHRRVPQIHAAARWAVPPAPGAPRTIRRAGPRHDVADGSLLDWVDKPATRLLGFQAPKPFVPFGDVHLAWSPEGLRFFHIGHNHVDLDLLAYDGDWPLSESYQLRFTVDAGAGARTFAVHLTPQRYPAAPERFGLVAQFWRHDGGRPVQRLDTAGRVTVLDKLLPHIQVEGLIPATLLGVEALRPGQELALTVEATNFYREVTMTLPAGRIVLGTATDSRPAAAAAAIVTGSAAAAH